MTTAQVKLPAKLIPVFEGEADVRGAWGGRGCVHPDTLIDVPGGQVAVKDWRGGLVWSWQDGERVLAWSTPAFPCTEEDLFEVSLDDGRSIIVTDHHKFLTNRGWVRLCDLRADDALIAHPQKFGACHPLTNSERVQPASPSDVRRSIGTPEDCQGDCSECHHRCDPQPLSAEEGVLASLPSQAYEQQHSSRVLCHSGAQVCDGRDSLSSASHHRSSLASLQAWEARYCGGTGNCNDGISSVSPWVSSQASPQSRARKGHWQPYGKPVGQHPVGGRMKRLAKSLRKLFGKPNGNESDNPCFTPVVGSFGLARIVSVRNHSRLVYWDLHVHGTNNYLSNGIVNHNSGKTMGFALMSAIRAYKWEMEGRTGIILCARQFMNSLADSSLEEVKAAIRDNPWLEPHFDIGETYIRTKSGRINYSFVGLARNLNSLKSKFRILLAWIDEAEPVTEEAWVKLIPTLRQEDSELWLTWNPERKQSATNKRFMNSTDPRTKIIRMNWSDNPFFPDILDRVRLKDQRERPDQYRHIWEGEYLTAIEGAYYAASLNKAREEGRVCRVAADPLMTLRAVWDIGGTGAKADATAIWIVQFIGKEIRFLDHYEAVGQPLATHVQWMRDNGYEKALCILPHDGAQHDKIVQTTYEGALRGAGFSVEVIPNQGAGAAMQRVEAMRRLFPQMWFDEERCAGGLDALGWYHEKRDEERGIGLGPNHDWSSHSADAGGLVAICYKEPVSSAPIRYNNRGVV